MAGVNKEKRGRGRPRKYPKDLANDGAPILSVRLDPAVYLHIQAQEEGPRAYVERLVLHDIELAARRQRSKSHDAE